MDPLGSLAPGRLNAALAAGALAVEVGPFRARVRSNIAALGDHLLRHYADYPLVPPDEMADFQLTLSTPGGLRRWYRRQVRFRYQAYEPFSPLPLDQAKHAFEWGFNWAIGAQGTRFLMLHAATVERGGQAIVLPAYSGSGKSTLCAALVHRGWRLLSDEFALISLDDQALYGLGRPISLKNESIAIVRRHFPTAEIGEVVAGTRKGTVGLLTPPEGSVLIGRAAMPRWVLAPRYEPDATPDVIPVEKSKMAFYLSGQAFNYHVLGERGFRTLCSLVETCDCLALSYASLDEALELVDRATAPAVGTAKRAAQSAAGGL